MQWCPRCQKNVSVNRIVTENPEKKERRTEVVCSACRTTLRVEVVPIGKKKGGC